MLTAAGFLASFSITSVPVSCSLLRWLPAWCPERAGRSLLTFVRLRMPAISSTNQNLCKLPATAHLQPLPEVSPYRSAGINCFLLCAPTALSCASLQHIFLFCLTQTWYVYTPLSCKPSDTPNWGHGSVSVHHRIFPVLYSSKGLHKISHITGLDSHTWVLGGQVQPLVEVLIISCLILPVRGALAIGVKQTWGEIAYLNSLRELRRIT